MELELTAEQDALLGASRRLISDHASLSRVRELAEGAEPDPKLIPRCAELGWLAAFVPEELGGGTVSGDAMGDMALVAELRGAGLLREPFIGANVASVLLAAASEELSAAVLSDHAMGEAIVVVPVDGLDGVGGLNVSATVRGDSLVLDGAVLVAGFDEVAEVLVVTNGEDRLAALVPVAAPGVVATPASVLDVTQPLVRLELRAVEVPLARTFLVSQSELEKATAVAATLSASESVGAMTALFDLTRTYALDRVAFGRPIGSFQAIKHLLADLSLIVESSTAVAGAAARAARGDARHHAEASHIAKVYIGERAATLAQGCMQVFGGIGFAWEHDLHLYKRRLVANAALFGTVDAHRRQILAAHAAELKE
jgi:alkylation response protein AidB-like acyl-CoA dehydrogenase